MGKVIDINTRKEIKDPEGMAEEWTAYALKYLGPSACTIYYDQTNRTLAYIAPDDRTLLSLIVGAFEQFKAQGIIKVQVENATFKDTVKAGLRKWKKLLKNSKKTLKN